MPQQQLWQPQQQQHWQQQQQQQHQQPQQPWQQCWQQQQHCQPQKLPQQLQQQQQQQPQSQLQQPQQQQQPEQPQSQWQQQQRELRQCLRAKHPPTTPPESLEPFAKRQRTSGSAPAPPAVVGNASIILQHMIEALRVGTEEPWVNTT